MSSDAKITDLAGIQPIAEAGKIVVEGVVAGGGNFLKAICLPAAEEYGLLLRDKISGWRAANVEKMLYKAQQRVKDRQKFDGLNAHPRVVGMAIDGSSWTDDDLIQGMWAGLLASACADGEPNEDNIIFLDVLKRMTPMQGRILNLAVEKAHKFTTSLGFVLANRFAMSPDELMENVGGKERHTVDYQIDHLASMGLINGGFNPVENIVSIGPTPIAINFYVRCQGFIGDSSEYFGELPVGGHVDAPVSSTQVIT